MPTPDSAVGIEFVPVSGGETMSENHPLHPAVQHITRHNAINAVYLPQARYPEREFADDATLLDVAFDPSAVSVLAVVRWADRALQQHLGGTVVAHDTVPGPRGTVRLRIGQAATSARSQ